MSDRPEEGEEGVSEAERRRAGAQGAAGDLARMGIDPRSLGLEGPGGPPSPGGRPVEQRPEQARGPAAPAPALDGPTGDVVPIRPGLDRTPPPPPPAGRGPAAPVPQAPADPPDVVRAPSTAEALLARTESAKPAPRDVGRLLRTVTLGLVTPDAAEASGQERDLVAAVRHRQTERRIVAFCSGKGGAGTTSVLTGVGAAFAALRDDRTSLLDVQPGSAPLSRQVGIDVGLPAGLLLGPDAALATVPETSAGLGVVDGVGWEQQLQRRDVGAVLDRLGADYGFTLVDVGNDPADGSHAVLARCDSAVVVTTTGAAGVAALEVALTRLAQINPTVARQAVVVVVCHHPDAYRTAHREISQRLGATPARLVVVPSDRVLRDGGPFDPARVGAATREAMLEVGAAVALPGSRA